MQSNNARSYFKNYGILIATICFLFPTRADCQLLKYNSDSISGHQFSIETFHQKLTTTLKDSAVGWAYTIWQNGQEKYRNQGGYKVTPSDRKDGKGLPFRIDTRIHIASMSKSITAIAVAKLVEMKKINWDSDVKSFLPSWWKYHSGYEHLTLKELVTMTSGLNAPLDAVSSGVDSLQLLLMRGPDTTKKGRFHYQNTGYGLLRIIIAYASGYKESNNVGNNRLVSSATAAMYKDFVNRYVFKPAGVDSADCKIMDIEPAMQYPFPYKGEAGELTGDADLSELSGAFGWYISASDAAKMLNAVLYKKTIISDKTLNELIALGFPWIVRNGRYGNYFGTGGDWGHPIKPDGWRGIHTYFLCFPDNIIVTVFLNSGEGSPSRKIMRAYLASFD